MLKKSGKTDLEQTNFVSCISKRQFCNLLQIEQTVTLSPLYTTHGKVNLQYFDPGTRKRGFMNVNFLFSFQLSRKLFACI